MKKINRQIENEQPSVIGILQIILLFIILISIYSFSLSFYNKISSIINIATSILILIILHKLNTKLYPYIILGLILKSIASLYSNFHLFYDGNSISFTILNGVMTSLLYSLPGLTFNLSTLWYLIKIEPCIETKNWEINSNIKKYSKIYHFYLIIVTIITILLFLGILASGFSTF